MENANYLLVVITIIWVVLFTYIGVLSHKQKRLRREIDLLKKNLRQQQPPKQDTHLSSSSKSTSL